MDILTMTVVKDDSYYANGNLRSKYKYRSSNIPSDNLASPESILHEESVVDRFIKVKNHLNITRSCCIP